MTNAELVSKETGIPIDALMWEGKYTNDPQGERATYFFCGPFDYSVEEVGGARRLARLSYDVDGDYQEWYRAKELKRVLYTLHSVGALDLTHVVGEMQYIWDAKEAAREAIKEWEEYRGQRI